MMNHIESLSRHGAQIRMPDGTLKSLTPEFYEAAVYECQEKGYRAATYDLVLPGISDTLWLAIWNDGHVDSGSPQSICACLDF